MPQNKNDYPTPEEQEKILNDLEEEMGPPPEKMIHGSGAPEEGSDGQESVLPDDEKTADAISSIVEKESTELLEAKDEKTAEISAPKKQKRTLRSLLSAWWHNKKARNITLAVLFAAIAAAISIPTSRYTLLNTVGVRVSATLTIVDEATGRPLKNADIVLQNATGKTDDEGKATLHDLRLGNSELTIMKRSFADVSQEVTLGWGSNQFTPFRLIPTGSEYTFVLTDWLSGKPVEGVEVKEGDSTALSNKDGKAVLKVDPGDALDLKVSIEAKQYRTESMTISANTKEPTNLTLVAGSPHFFVSRRDGTYDVYKIDADGKNEELLLKGTGKERDDMVLSPSPDRRLAAFISTRKGLIDQNGYVLQTLYILDIETKELTEIVTSEQIRFVGWEDQTVVYVKVASGTSAADSNRQQLMSYNFKDKNGLQLAANNMFNDVALTRGKVFYAPSNIYGDEPGAAFFSVNADGTEKKTLLNREVWSFIRTAYDQFALSAVGNKWYSYTIGSDAASDMATPTATPKDRRYLDNPSETKSLWYDYRDGRGVVVVWDIAGKSDAVLYSAGGLTGPLQWLSDKHAIYRVVTNEETADYVINVDGGDPKKIDDVAVSSTETTYGYYY